MLSFQPCRRNVAANILLKRGYDVAVNAAGYHPSGGWPRRKAIITSAGKLLISAMQLS